MGQKPTGILVSPANAELMKPEIDAAIAAGVPVITIDSDARDSKRLFFIGTNNYQAGLMGGKVAADKLKGHGEVVVFSMPGQTNLDERLRGYREAFAAHPQIKIEQIVDIKGDARIAFDTTTQILADKKSKIDGFICLEALAGKEVANVLDRYKVSGKVVIAMDTDSATLDWIRKGVIAATIAQKPYTMSAFGLRMLDSLYHNHVPTLQADWSNDSFSPLPAFVDTGATLIDKSNLDTFEAAQKSATQK
jgi:ribose transport system substrate-binding protein